MFYLSYFWIWEIATIKKPELIIPKVASIINDLAGYVLIKIKQAIEFNNTL